MDRWRGQVAVVTGASSGIGAATAKLLVKEGIKVVGLARRKDKIDELSEKLKDLPGKFYGFQADVSKEADIIAAFQWINNNVGPISILINNAGIMKQTNLSDGDALLWKAMFDINVLGLSIATREAVKNMKANNINGHIIHINSIVGHYVPDVPGANVYPASKFAVTALTETLRQELNRCDSKIKVTSLSPGLVATELFLTGNLAELYNTAPYLQAEDVANGILYVLATPPHVQVREIIISPVGEKF